MLNGPNIDTSSEEYGQMLMDCIDATEDIFNAILSRDVQLINDHIRTI